MIKLLLKVFTFGWYDPNEARLREAEREIDVLQAKARRFDALHPEDRGHVHQPH